jgi:hypothetical protein
MAEAAPGDAVALNEESAVSAVEPSPAPTPMSPAPPSGPKGPRAGGFGQAEDAGSSRTLQGADSAESVDVASVGFTPRIAKTAFGHDEQLIAAAAASSPVQLASDVVAQIEANEVDTLGLQCKYAASQRPVARVCKQ